jgi:hypothetical protein
MPKRNYTKFLANTCTACWVKVYGIGIKLDLEFFMQKAFYLGFNPYSNFTDLKKIIKDC